MEITGCIEAEKFCLIHDIDVAFVYTLSDYGLIETMEEEQVLMIPLADIQPLEKFIRLSVDMDINMEGIHAIAHLLKQMRAMEDELVALRRKLAFYE